MSLDLATSELTTTEREVALTVQGLSKVYRMVGRSAGPMLPHRSRRRDRTREGKLWALNDVTFDLGRGEVLGVIGANGAGKSTLLKILGRVTPPSAGRAVVHGRVVPLLELGNAFQQEATGRDNVFLNAALYGIPRAVVYRRLDDIVAFAELEEFIDEPVKRYSSGMYARLAFSVAVNMDPDVLLADEILAVGDMIFQERCLERIREAGSQGTTVLFVSHDMSMIRSMCTRAIWLEEGRVAADGPPDEVISAYEDAARARAAARLANGPPKGGDQDAAVSPQQRAAEAAAAYGRLVSVQLLDAAGKEAPSVPLNEECSIAVTFETFRDEVDVRCGLALTTDAGVSAFRSPQPAVVHLATAGTYRASARIPAHLLNDVVYSVKVAVAIEGADFNATLVVADALTFQAVEETGSSAARGTYPHPLPGVVRPLLAWSMQPCGEQAHES